MRSRVVKAPSTQRRRRRVQAPWRPGRVALLATGAMLPSVAGCVRWTAPVDRDFERGEIVVHVESISGRRMKESHVVLETRQVPNAVTLLQATVTARPQACEAGAYAMRLGRDRASTVEAPLVPGERLTLTFPQGTLNTLGGTPAHLELLVRGPNGKVRCLTLALAESAPLVFEPQERFTFGFAGSIEAFTRHIGPVSQMIVLPAEIGVWLGDVHAHAGGGFAWAGCPDSQCARPSEDQRINYATGFTGFAGADVFLYERGEFGFGASLRYRVLTLNADTREGRVEHWAHGPVLAPYFAVVWPPATPSAKGSREGPLGLEIPVGYAFADNGERTVTIGGNLRIFFSVL
jgi:hypothetical protein